MPGDLLDLDQSLRARADHTLQAITEARIAWVPEPTSGGCCASGRASARRRGATR
jgi:hypothetical protein